MPNPSARKAKKAKQRQQRLRHREVHERQQLQRDISRLSFPEFVIQADGVPEPLVNWVTKAVHHVSRHYEDMLPSAHVQAFRRAKEEGFAFIFDAVEKYSLQPGKTLTHMRGYTASDDLPRSLPAKTLQTSIPHWLDLMTSVGDALLHTLPTNVFDAYFPYTDIQVLLERNIIKLFVRTLRTAKTPGGTAYYSPHAPTITTPRGDKIVGFYRHAIERICERAVGNWRTYLGLGDAFGFLHDCVYFEPWHNNNEGGFSLYDSCNLNFFSAAYVQAILGEEHNPEGYYYRLGYCPTVEIDNLVVAKTLLSPGMRQTPEYDWYMRTVSSGARDREVLSARVAKLTRKALAESRDFSLLKQFHEGEIPQVVRLEQRVYGSQ